MQDFTFGRQLAVVARLWRWALDQRLQSLGLSQARFVLLVHLVEAPGPLAQSDLAERAGISGPTLVRQLDLLEADGLVKRRDTPTDRRVKHVCVTETGHSRCERAREIAAKLREELVSPYPDSTVRETLAMLQGIANKIEGMRNGPKS
jgi:MarR family transcriptional regulator, transcriptional regulator for hemolysin